MTGKDKSTNASPIGVGCWMLNVECWMFAPEASHA
jgi:hypothetical protein